MAENLFKHRDYTNENYQEDSKIVNYVINNYFKHLNLEREDLIQTGLIACWNARDKFYKDKLTNYTTFAVHCCKNAIIDLIRSNKNYLKLQRVSLDDEIMEGLTFADVIADDNEFEIKDNSLTKIVNKFRNQLVNNRDVIDLVLQGNSLRQIGKMFGVSNQYLSQLYKKFINQLRTFIKTNDIEL